MLYVLIIFGIFGSFLRNLGAIGRGTHSENTRNIGFALFLISMVSDVYLQGWLYGVALIVGTFLVGNIFAILVIRTLNAA